MRRVRLRIACKLVSGTFAWHRTWSCMGERRAHPDSVEPGRAVSRVEKIVLAAETFQFRDVVASVKHSRVGGADASSPGAD